MKDRRTFGSLSKQRPRPELSHRPSTLASYFIRHLTQQSNHKQYFRAYSNNRMRRNVNHQRKQSFTPCLAITLSLVIIYRPAPSAINCRIPVAYQQTSIAFTARLRMQSAILFYHFRPSVRLPRRRILVLYRNDCTCICR